MNDNVRKIFEILGVEPNEEFKIDDKNRFWKIDEKLNLYYRQGHYDNGDYAYNDFNNSLIIDLINNPKRITKLPKESKKIKKKLRDLTVFEYYKWHQKNCFNCYSAENCVKCIFNVVTCNKLSYNCWVYNKDLYSDKFLDQEVEVEK